MLVREVFGWLGKAQRGVALLQERHVVAPAQIAVMPLDHADLEAFHVALALLFRVARELARERIVLAARGHQLAHGLAHFLGRRDTLGEQAHLLVVDLAIVALRAADDVVGEHAGHVPVLFPRTDGPVAGADQALLFGGHGHEHERRVELVLGHHARQFHDRGGARCIVVRARRVRGGVHHVRGARVIVTADHVHALFGSGLRAGQRCDDIDDLGRLGDARRDGRHVAVIRDLQWRAGAAALELGLDPAAGSADAARWRLGLGHRVARAEADQLADMAFDALLRDFAQDLRDLGLLRGDVGLFRCGRRSRRSCWRSS